MTWDELAARILQMTPAQRTQDVLVRRDTSEFPANDPPEIRQASRHLADSDMLGTKYDIQPGQFFLDILGEDDP